MLYLWLESYTPTCWCHQGRPAPPAPAVSRGAAAPHRTPSCNPTTHAFYTTSTTVWQQHLGLGFFRFLFIFHVLMWNTDVFTVLYTDHINGYLQKTHSAWTSFVGLTYKKAFLYTFCWFFYIRIQTVFGIASIAIYKYYTENVLSVLNFIAIMSFCNITHASLKFLPGIFPQEFLL